MENSYVNKPSTMKLLKEFREKLEKGTAVFGPFMKTGTTDILVIIGDLTGKPVLLALFGVVLTAVLIALRSSQAT